MGIKITSAQFVACSTGVEGFPKERLPIVAFAGRSNVGKSSLINLLAGRKELAKTSSLPGKTLTLNFYLFNQAFYIVDLPGYGFAKASRVTRERIQKMMDEFFMHVNDHLCVIQVIDIRHPPSIMDQEMSKWIKEQGFQHQVVLTKTDKVSHNEARRMQHLIHQKIDIPRSIVVSHKSEIGREELFEIISKFLGQSRVEPKTPGAASQDSQIQRPSNRLRPSKKEIEKGSRSKKAASSPVHVTQKPQQSSLKGKPESSTQRIETRKPEKQEDAQKQLSPNTRPPGSSRRRRNRKKKSAATNRPVQIKPVQGLSPQKAIDEKK